MNVPPRPGFPRSAATHPPAPLRVRELGRLAYGPALAEQRRINQRVIDGDDPPTLLLLEHEPVITISHRRGAERHLLAPRRRLAELGIAVETTDRGGDITYHGPGQLIAYPILQLNPLGLNLSRYMRLLEQIVIDTLASFGLKAMRDHCATGVWVAKPTGEASGNTFGDALTPNPALSNNACVHESPAAPTAKICAMGVRVRRNTTMHGLALNVDPDLTHFDTIVPCGLHGRAVTSLTQQLGDHAPTIEQVKAQLADQMQRAVRECLTARAP